MLSWTTRGTGGGGRRTGRALVLVAALATLLGVLASPPAQAAPAPKVWSNVSAGLENGCGVHRDRTLWCWGANEFKVVGDGTTTDRPAPVQVMPGSRFQQVSAGWIYSCALRTDGSAWCWGWNDHGQLGDGTTTNSATPRRVLAPSGVRFRSVAASKTFATTCGIDTRSRLWCWGFARSGDADVLTPRQVGTAAGWTVVSVGGWNLCGLRGGGPAGGRLFCFADPVAAGSPGGAVEPGMRWRTVSTGSATCAIRTDGRLFCGGGNVGGEAGGQPGQDRPFQPLDDRAWRAVSAGSYLTCGVRTDGTAWCWGALEYAGDVRQIGTGTDWTTVSAVNQACGLRRDGSAWCWNGYAGTLGDGSTAQEWDQTAAHRVTWLEPRRCPTVA